MSRNLDVTPDGGATGFACEPAADLFVGRIESVVGSCTLARPGELPAEIKAGDRIRPDDVIETSAGGRVGIRFLDGSVFNLSDRARMAVKEFIADGASPNALFDISNGTFAFIAGQMAKAGRLGIETPFGKIRGRSGAGGIGMLSLVSLFFAALEEVQAFESGYSYLDDGQINYQDSQEFKDAPVGTVELIIPATGNQPEQHIMLGDASQSIVIRSLTNSTVVSYVQNSLTDMLRNDKAAADAIHLYSLGQSGPAGFGNGGSSGLPPEFQPVIQENNVLPPPTGGGALGGGPLGSSGQQSNAPEVLPVIKPPTPPEAVPDSNSIIANPDSSAAGNVLTNDAVTGPGTTGVGSLTVINVQDADENQPVAAGSTSTTNFTVIHGLYGTLRIGADGSYNYEVNADNPTVKALGQGQSIQDDPFTYTVTDGTTTAQTTLTITVTGVNDAPLANADTNWAKEVTSGAIGNVLQTLAHNGSPSGSFSDNADTDVDNGTTLTVTNIQDANENLAVTAGTTSANGTVIHGLYGTLTIGANGSYSYTPKDDIDNAAGVQDVFTYTVTDGSAPVTSTLTITVFDGAGPTHGNAITLNVDEAALSTAGATGSNPSSTAEIDSSALSFTAGSDSLTSFGFSSDLTGLVKDLNLDGTDDIFWLRLSDTQIKGYLDAGHTQTAVTLDLSAATIAAGAVGFATVTMTLSDNLKNPTGLGAQINSLGNVGVVATDRDGDSTTGAVNLTAKDDTPTATPANSSGTSVYPDTNLLITLDLSGSMDQASGTGGLTKLELAKQAILELIEQYDALGHVKVELVTFSDTAANASGGWVDLDNAAAKTALINSILGLSTSGSTNYDAALAMDMTAYNGSGKLATPGVQNVAYFLSDGEPTLGDGNTSALTNNSSSSSSDIGIQPAEETIWTTFVNNNNIDSFALGMGSAATQSSLNPIAYDGRGAGTNTNGQVVTDLSQLIGTLVATVNASPVSGDLISGGVVAKFGADGGQFKSLQVDNTTYTLNGTSISVTGGPDPAHTFSFDTNTGVLTVSTNAGGTIALDMQGADVGHYTYTPPASPSTTEVFNYTVMDGDGDTAGSSLTVTISPATTPPVVRDDFVVTNQTSVQLPDWVLLNNDTGPNSASQFISGVSQPANGDSVSHANGIVTYTDNNPAGGSFVYTDTAGSTSDTAKVTIARDTSGAIDGTFLNEILVGGTGNDTINGNEGNDILIGNGGTNTLNGGPGADIMSGGGGANTYLFASGDSPANVGGSGNSGTIAGFDVITDFSTTADKLSLPGTPVAVANSSGTNGTDSILTVGGQTVKSHAISNGIITFDDANTFSTPLSLTSAANVAAVVDYLQHNDIGNAGATVAFTATINSVNHTFIYEQVANSPNSANDILIDLSGTTVSNLSTLISGGHIDPIVLDLDTPGISFTSMANGVSFDINGDGVADHIAWTAGNDGFLAYDVNGNGTIDNGNELFTPNFAGGHFASGLAALASLDSNGDSVIDSADAAYAKLEVWQDTNHNGTADAGEMSSLAENGITAINLDGTPDNGTIDGQQLQAQGSFSNADGTTGSYVEVALDSTLGTPPTNAESPSNSTFTAGDDTIYATAGGVLTGGGGNDTFIFKSTADSPPGDGQSDTITDFTHNSDHIDLSQILGLANIQGQVAAANTIEANSVSWFVDNAHNETIVYVNTTTAANHVDMEIHLTGTNINLTGSDILHHA